MKHSRRNELVKFLIVLTIFIVYLLFSVLQFGLSNGVLVAALSWSFFVFCTPIADAGFLLDFPIRLITGVRMLYTETGVWIFAIVLNIFAALYNPLIYQKTVLLSLFKQIVTTPWPLGLIILLSASGTFLSVFLGDDAFTIAYSKNKKEQYRKERHKLIFTASSFIITFILYIVLLKFTNIHIKLA